MEIITFILMLPVFLASPEVSASWTSQALEHIQVEVSGEEEFIRPCLYGGLEVAYRYELQLCKNRTLWLDPCKESKLVIHSLKLDPISENYIVSKDLLRDDDPPLSRSIRDFREAIEELASIKQFPVQILSSGKQTVPKRPRDYIGLRVVAECRGEYNKNLARVASLLTFGITSSDEFDTGWVDFSLAK